MINLYAAFTKPGAEVLYRHKTGSAQTGQLFHFIQHTLPRVSKLLSKWRGVAEICPDPELRMQALNSISNKDFHCQGGAFFAIPYPDSEDLLLNLIVAYQTLCDYLDNLCDRTKCLDGRAFLDLHLSLLDALSPGDDIHNYYCSYPYQNDGGYIVELVEECRKCVQLMPSYYLVHPKAIELVNLYIDLQVKKHISWETREQELIDWSKGHLADFPGVRWNEFAAAAGSTLALFALLGLATKVDAGYEEMELIYQTYFPWICGLHILLDYFIDQEEDRNGGDLNFTFYYPDQKVMVQRLKVFILEAHKRASLLPEPCFTKTVIEGLLAMYFSDQKVNQQGFANITRQLLKESGKGARYTYHICRLVRQVI